MNERTFDAKKHVHTLDGKNLTGVTTVLSVIAKPALIQWAADMVRFLYSLNWSRKGEVIFICFPLIPVTAYLTKMS